MTSSMPWTDRWSRTWSRMGLSTSGSSCFGMLMVRGRIRVPYPPTRTIAFIGPVGPSTPRSPSRGGGYRSPLRHDTSMARPRRATQANGRRTTFHPLERCLAKNV